MNLTFYLLLMLTFAFTSAFLAERKGRDHRTWFVLGALLGFVSLVILLVQPGAQSEAKDA